MEQQVITPVTLPAGGYTPPSSVQPVQNPVPAPVPQEFRATQEMAGLVEYHKSLEEGKRTFLLKCLEVSIKHLQVHPRDQVNAAFTAAGLITPFTVTYYDFVSYPNDVKLIIYNFLLANKVVKDLNNPEAPEKLIYNITKYLKMHKCAVCKQIGHPSTACPKMAETVCNACNKIGHKICCSLCKMHGHAANKCRRVPHEAPKQPETRVFPAASPASLIPSQYGPGNLTQLFPPTSFDPLMLQTMLMSALQMQQQAQQQAQPKGKNKRN